MPQNDIRPCPFGLFGRLFQWISFFTLLYAQTLCAQQWVQIADFPSTARDDGASFMIDNKAYCGTGLQTGFVAGGDLYALDLENESWLPIAQLPSGEERQYASGFAAQGKGFLFGGIRENTYLNNLWMYDPIANSWMAKAALPGPGRMGSGCFTLGDTAYIIGGRTANALSIDELWAYSISGDTWHYKGLLPFGARWRASACSHQGLGYLAFGVDGDNRYRNELYAFNQETQQWQALTEFPGPGRAYVGLQSFGNDLLAVCGLDSSMNSYNDLWRFSPNTSSWQQLGALPATQRRGGMVFTSQTALYYTTGIDENNVRLRESWRISEPTALPITAVNHEIKLSPNPCESFLEVKGIHGQMSFTLTTASGHCIMKGTIEPHGSMIDVSHLAKGIYYVHFVSDNSSEMQKFIKR